MRFAIGVAFALPFGLRSCCTCHCSALGDALCFRKFPVGSRVVPTIIFGMEIPMEDVTHVRPLAFGVCAYDAVKGGQRGREWRPCFVVVVHHAAIDAVLLQRDVRSGFVVVLDVVRIPRQFHQITTL